MIQSKVKRKCNNPGLEYLNDTPASYIRVEWGGTNVRERETLRRLRWSALRYKFDEVVKERRKEQR